MERISMNKTSSKSYTFFFLLPPSLSLQHWLAGTSPCPSITAHVDDEILSSLTLQLKEALKRELEGPMNHRAFYGKREREKKEGGR